MTLKSYPWFAIGALLLGCGQAKHGGLVIADLRLDESTVPLPFVVALHNDGDMPVGIQGVSVNVTSKTLISRTQDAERIPDGFDFQVEFDPNHPAEVPADSDGVACGFVVWELPPDPPPMIAVVTCDFRVHADRKTLATEAVTMVRQSQKGLLAGGSSVADNPLASEQAKRATELISALPGRKSPGFAQLRERLKIAVVNEGDQ